MKILVTGSAGHLGEALVRTLRCEGHSVIGLDIVASAETDVVGSITDRRIVRECMQGMQGINAVLHTATLHKPHVATHSRQAFIDTNITGTLTLLEEAVAARVNAFIFTAPPALSAMHCRPRQIHPPHGLTKMCRWCQRTFTASRNRLPRICASCSIEIMACQC